MKKEISVVGITRKILHNYTEYVPTILKVIYKVIHFNYPSLMFVIIEVPTVRTSINRHSIIRHLLKSIYDV